MLTCPSCGAGNSEESRFCTECGANLAAKDSAAEARCSGCGAVVPPDARFCVTCGRPIGGVAASAPGLCRVCGAKVEPGSQFCTNCGATLSGQVMSQPASPANSVAADMDATGAAYLNLLNARLPQAGFQAVGPVAGFEADRIYTRQRFEMSLLNKVTTFCAIRSMPGPVTADSLRAYSQALYQHAQTQRSSLSRLTVQPLFIYAVMVAGSCPADSRAFLDTYWPKHFMAFEFPLVVMPASKELYCRRSTPLWGLAFHKSILREAESLFTP